MKMKTEKLALIGTFAELGHLSLLALLLSVSISIAAAASDQLDPADLLESDLQQTVDANIRTIPTQPTKPQPAPQKPIETMNTVSISFASQVNQKLPGANPPAADSNNSLGHQLQQARITASVDDKGKNKDELQNIIEQIRAVEFESQNKQSEPVVVTQSVPSPDSTELAEVEPNENPPATETAAEPNDKQAKSELQTPATENRIPLPYKPITTRTLQAVSELSQHPEQLSSPFELAEILFRSGNLKEAAVFYQQALNKINPKDAASASNRAWILFQIGNCLRNDEPQNAMKTYRQLITEYPGSPWTEIAKARDKLIDWYQKDDPKTVIKENKP
jgi:tetratricopeptide (TPR) repeat protein